MVLLLFRSLEKVCYSSCVLFVLFFISGSINAAELPDFADLAEELVPSVVTISTINTVDAPVQGIPQFPPGSPFEEFFRDFFERRGGVPRQQPQQRQQPQNAMGSGFIIDSKGYIITNNHVIADATNITVIMYDGNSFTAEVVGADPKSDIALLKIEADIELKAVVWGDSDNIRVGNWVLAIGNPFGLVNTVTTGIISAIARDISAGPFDDFIQTDAAINRGNSGGPLFNINGEVIGVNTAIYSPTGGSVGIGFAVPSSLAKSVAQQLKDFGRTKRGWLGVRIQTVTDDLAESLGLVKAYGALVASVMPDSPALTAGIKAGDVVIGFNGKEVTSMRSLPRMVADSKIDKKAKLEIWRGGKSIFVDVLIGEMEEEPAKKASLNNNNEENILKSIDSLGLQLSALTSQVRERFNLPDNIQGVMIARVSGGSDSERQGIMPGDIIVEVEQESVTSPDEIISKVEKASSAGRKSILFLINRKGDLSFVALKLN